MSKVFQPIVQQHSEEIIEDLTESGFFEEYEITDMEYVKICLCEKLTDKFIAGAFDNETPIFTEDEFTLILQELVAGTLLNSLKSKGYINSYADDDTEEVFFLTEEGRKFVEEQKKKPD